MAWPCAEADKISLSLDENFVCELSSRKKIDDAW
jgi:hypothetical protein